MLSPEGEKVRGKKELQGARSAIFNMGQRGEKRERKKRRQANVKRVRCTINNEDSFKLEVQKEGRNLSMSLSKSPSMIELGAFCRQFLLSRKTCSRVKPVPKPEQRPTTQETWASRWSIRRASNSASRISDKLFGVRISPLIMRMKSSLMRSSRAFVTFATRSDPSHGPPLQ